MIPGHKHLVFAEGLRSAGITESRGPKSDKRDAYALTEKLRLGSLDKTVLKARAGSPACASSRAFT
jgi:hypothetical protein